MLSLRAASLWWDFRRCRPLGHLHGLWFLEFTGGSVKSEVLFRWLCKPCTSMQVNRGETMGTCGCPGECSRRTLEREVDSAEGPGPGSAG